MDVPRGILGDAQLTRIEPLSFAGARGGPRSVYGGHGTRGRRGAMSWADSEFQDASFGDDRLRQRAIRVCERLAEHPGESIPVACCGRAEVEAAYRFFSNAKVTAARVLASHHEASLRRLAAHPVVLCVQDTTELDFTGKQTTGLGPLNYTAPNGLYLHVTTALTPLRQALGVVTHEFFVHAPACFGQARKRAPSALMPGRSRRRRVAVGCGPSRACARSPVWCRRHG